MGYKVILTTPEGTSTLPDIYPDEAAAEAAGEAWATGLPVDDETYHASYGYDLEETPDWEALKASVRPWQVFYDVRRDDEMDASDVAKGLKNSFEHLLDSNTDFISDQGFEGANQILKDHGFEPQDWQDDEGFDELRFAVEGAAEFNVSAIAPSTLFIRMDEEIEVPDYTDGDSMEEAKALLLPLATQHGFTEAELDRVLSEASYGGSAGVGVLADGGDVMMLGMQGANDGNGLNSVVSGQPILYCSDNMNGSGSYVLGKGNAEVTVNNLAESIDYGRYSLGAVFGTSDWNYR